MKKARSILIFIVALAFVLALCSCGGTNTDNTDATSTAPAPTEQIEPTTEPTDEPTAEPTQKPTQEPTAEPTAEPTTAPVVEPTAEPTQEPTTEPTAEPTSEPTAEPTTEQTKEPDVPVVPSTLKFVYLNANAGVVAEAVQFDNVWVIRSTGSAIDVTTGKEVGSIRMEYGTYTSREDVANATASMASGGYFLVDYNNNVISKVDETATGKYGIVGETDADSKYIGVHQGTITSAETSGKTIATMNGYKNVDITNYEFKFLYHDLDGNRFGIGGDNTSVQVATVEEIEKTYESQAKIVDEGVGGANMYTEDDVAEAQSQIEAIKDGVIDKYFNGTFWNVPMSPVNNYMAVEAASYQNPNATLTFNYVVIGQTVYVFVNSFTK